MAKPIIGPIITLAIEDINADLNENTLNLVSAIPKDIKIKNRRESAGLVTPNHLLFVSHPHVYTLGKSGDLSNLLLAALH